MYELGLIQPDIRTDACDFKVFNHTSHNYFPGCWLDNTEGKFRTIDYEYLEPSHVILPLYSPRMEEHMVDSLGEAYTLISMGITPVIQVLQSTTEIKFYNQIPCKIAIRNSDPRYLYMTPELARKVIFYECTTLQELKRYPVKTLITSLPYTSALRGIELAERIRKPKNLAALHHQAKFEELHLTYAIKNLHDIREALKFGNELYKD